MLSRLRCSRIVSPRRCRSASSEGIMSELRSNWMGCWPILLKVSDRHFMVVQRQAVWRPGALRRRRSSGVQCTIAQLQPEDELLQHEARVGPPDEGRQQRLVVLPCARRRGRLLWAAP